MVNTVAGRGSASSPLERVKAAIHQELLVLDICQESSTKRYLYLLIDLEVCNVRTESLFGMRIYILQ